MAGREDALVEKLKTLPLDVLNEVEDFVDFVRAKAADRQLARDVSRVSEPSFAKVWDNPVDAEYDAL